MAKGDSALGFTIDQTVDNAWGITFLYGCTALIISDPQFVIGTHIYYLYFYLMIPKHLDPDELLCQYRRESSSTDISLVAHMQQVAGAKTICIKDIDAVNKYLHGTLLTTLSLVRTSNMQYLTQELTHVLQYASTPATRIDIFYNDCDTSPSSSGITTIKNFLLSDSLDDFDDPSQIKTWGYSGGGLGLPNPSSPIGLAVVQVR